MIYPTLRKTDALSPGIYSEGVGNQKPLGSTFIPFRLAAERLRWRTRWATTVTSWASWTIGNRPIEISSSALYFFDYLLTLPQEVDNIWSRKTSTATILFLLNRYVFMVNRTLRLIQTVSWENQFEDVADRICTISWKMGEACQIVTYTVVVLIAAIRVFAIWGRRRTILVCMLSIGLVNPVVTSYYATTLMFSALPPPLTGCAQQSSLYIDRVGSKDLFYIFATVAGAAFQCAVITLTWIKTRNVYRSLCKMTPAQSSQGLSFILLRQGVIHFATFMVLDIMSWMSVRVDALTNIPAMMDTLVSILVSRFILDLRDQSVSSEVVANWPLHLSHSTTVHLSSGRSCPLIGNLDGSLILYGDDRERYHGNSIYDCERDSQQVSCQWTSKGMTGGSPISPREQV